jgi:hypothetical protein
MENGRKDDLYEELERRALFDMPDEEPGDDMAPDLVGTIRGDEPRGVDRDVTLGGYIELHDRVPAFEGSDGQPYTVDVDVVQDTTRGATHARGHAHAPGDAHPGSDAHPGGDAYVAFFVFIRWAATGAGIMDHVESGDIARGESEEIARRAALDLSLYEVKAELDAAIERRQRALEE